jgi:hypothetical protein
VNLVVALLACSVLSTCQQSRGIDSKVEAFVPDLTPIGNAERPSWQESTARDLDGAVQMLVMIDESGTVVNVEALTGPAAMRDVAVAAVRTWRFNPVIRDGHAVAAYTTELLTHYIRSRKHSYDDLKNHAAYDREEALRERFPRTDIQVLADLEQNSIGTTGSGRVERLSSLTKAAWLAGDTNKAVSYANELLARVGELQLTMERNDAINDGNTILGLVAFRQGDVDKANWYLLESAKLPGGLAFSKPRMALANALLQHGETATVLEYLKLCRTHWMDSAKDLELWTKAVVDGKTPDFGVDAEVFP